MTRLILASSSETRVGLLRRAGLEFEVRPPRIDESALRQGLTAEGASPRDLADALAEYKALRIAAGNLDATVIGSDQILELDGQALGKPACRAEAEARLRALRGRTHRLLTAVVVYADGAPVWRHLSEARLTMRDFSDAFLYSYLDQIGAAATRTVGAYEVEGLGARLFERIEGDYFGILGLPLIELLTILARRGEISG